MQRTWYFYSAVGQRGTYHGKFQGTKIIEHSCVISSLNVGLNSNFESLDLLILNFTKLKIDPLIRDVPLSQFQPNISNVGNL